MEYGLLLPLFLEIAHDKVVTLPFRNIWLSRAVVTLWVILDRWVECTVGSCHTTIDTNTGIIVHRIVRQFNFRSTRKVCSHPLVSVVTGVVVLGQRCPTHILQLKHNSLGSSRLLIFEFVLRMKKSRLLAFRAKYNQANILRSLCGWRKISTIVLLLHIFQKGWQVSLFGIASFPSSSAKHGFLWICRDKEKYYTVKYEKKRKCAVSSRKKEIAHVFLGRGRVTLNR